MSNKNKIIEVIGTILASIVVIAIVVGLFELCTFAVCKIIDVDFNKWYAMLPIIFIALNNLFPIRVKNKND